MARERQTAMVAAAEEPDWAADADSLLAIAETGEAWLHAAQMLPALLPVQQVYSTVRQKAQSLAWALRPAVYADPVPNERAIDAYFIVRALDEEFRAIMFDLYGLRVNGGVVNVADPDNPVKRVDLVEVDEKLHHDRLMGKPRAAAPVLPADRAEHVRGLIAEVRRLMGRSPLQVPSEPAGKQSDRPNDAREQAPLTTDMITLADFATLADHDLKTVQNALPVKNRPAPVSGNLYRYTELRDAAIAVRPGWEPLLPESFSEVQSVLKARNQLS